MQDSDKRDMSRYHAFYNANKLAYSMNPQNTNVVNQVEDDKLPKMVFNPDNEEFEEKNFTAAHLERASDPTLKPT